MSVLLYYSFFFFYFIIPNKRVTSIALNNRLELSVGHIKHLNLSPTYAVVEFKKMDSVV